MALFHNHCDARSLPSLPSEIKIRIVEELGALAHPLAFKLHRHSQGTLLSLCLSSKAFYEWAEPILYRHITIPFSEIAHLNNTLCYYQGNFRPSLKVLRRRVVSLRVTNDLIDEDSPDGSASSPSFDDLMYLLEHVSPSLERLCVHVAITAKLSSFLVAEMGALKSWIVQPAEIDAIPRLKPGVHHMAIYVSPSLASSFGRHMGNALTPPGSSDLEQLVLPDLDLSDLYVDWAGMIGQLVTHAFPKLRRILIIPTGRCFWEAATGRSQPLETFKDALNAWFLRNRPEMVERLLLVQLARIPQEVLDVQSWINQKFYDGTAWDLEGVVYREFKALLRPRRYNQANNPLYSRLL